MKPTFSARHSLDITLFLDRFLLSEWCLDRVQGLLRECAPAWAAGLHVWREEEAATPVAIHAPGALEQAVRARGAERGPLYHALVRQSGAATPPRLFGDAEVRGADASLCFLAHFDEEVIRRCGDLLVWGNSLWFHVYRARVAGTESVAWSARLFASLCEVLSPVYARAHVADEFDAKNLCRDDGGMRAVGVDVSRSLPGLYWLNFLGAPYRDMIGRERLLSAPAHEVREVDRGMLLSLAPDPRDWDTPEYEKTERSVLDGLGRQYFFSIKEPDRKTIAPDFGVSPLPRAPFKRSWWQGLLSGKRQD